MDMNSNFIKRGMYLKHWVYYIIGVLPIAFFFHLYEYHQHLNKEDATLLLPIMIAYILLSSWFATYKAKRIVLLIQVVSLIVSFICGAIWIEDDGTWFIPGGLYVAILFVWIIVIIIQWVLIVLFKQTNKK